MNRKDKVAVSLLKPINPSLIIILGVYTIVWGLWIFSPFWTVFNNAPLYGTMAGIGSEYFWGVIAVLSGAVTTRGALKPSYSNVQLGAFVAFFHWFIISIMYFIGDWTSTGGITSLTFAVYSAIIWVNMKVNREYYKAKL